MEKAKKTINNEKMIFAGPVFQEYLPKIIRVIKKMKLQEKVHISCMGCTPGYVGVYAEFSSVSEKKKFLRKIHENYAHNMAWAA